MLNHSEPAAKKLRLAGGMGFPTAVNEPSDPTTKRKYQIENNAQWKQENYRGALQEYFQKHEPDVKLEFETVQMNENDPRATRIFISTCKAGNVKATGEEAGTKKKAIQFAALAAIKEMKFVTEEQLMSIKVNAKEGKNQNAAPRKKKENKPLIENQQYLSKNYRGALQEHLVRHHPGSKLEFKYEQLKPPPGPLFVARCNVVGPSESKVEPYKDKVGTGHGASKKGAMKFAVLQLMIQMGLLDEATHHSIHKENDAAFKPPAVNNTVPGAVSTNKVEHQGLE